MRWRSQPKRSLLADIEQRERAAAERAVALDKQEGNVKRLVGSLERRVSAMVLQAGTLDQLISAAGRDLDPQARVALGAAASAIRAEGRAALDELRGAVGERPPE